jgi:hypothetical protein
MNKDESGNRTSHVLGEPQDGRSWRGVLQVDGYAGFTERGDIILAACWGHTRRKF